MVKVMFFVMAEVPAVIVARVGERGACTLRWRVHTGVNTRQSACSGQLVPLVRVDVSLIQDTSESTHRNLGSLGDYRGVDDFSRPADEFDVAALLTRLNKSRRLKPALDFAEGLRLKPPQPRPRRFER